MANTLTDVQDLRIADKFLAAFVAELTALRAFSTDFTPEFAKRGKTVNVPVIGAANASYDFAGSYSANADSDVEGIPVVLDRHKVQSLHLTDKEVSESSWVSMERLAISKARQLAQDVLTDIWSLVTIANYGAASIPGLLATDFNSDSVLAIRQACAAAKMPANDRALILDSSYYSNLLGDAKISNSYLNQMAKPSLMEAKIPRVYGFDIYETTIMPDNAENLVGFAAHPRGIAVAMRYLQPIDSSAYLDAGPVTDQATGITLGYRKYYDTDSGKMIAAFECVYGYRKAIADGIKRIEDTGV